jgi:hypothetical protein
MQVSRGCEAVRAVKGNQDLAFEDSSCAGDRWIVCIPRASHHIGVGGCSVSGTSVSGTYLLEPTFIDQNNPHGFLGKHLLIRITRHGTRAAGPTRDSGVIIRVIALRRLQAGVGPGRPRAS